MGNGIKDGSKGVEQPIDGVRPRFSRPEHLTYRFAPMPSLAICITSIMMRVQGGQLIQTLTDAVFRTIEPFGGGFEGIEGWLMRLGNCT